MSSPASGRYTQAAPHASTPPPASGRLRGTDKPYQVNGQWYFPHADPSYDAVGTASWYGYPFQRRRTADGEVYDEALITAAHKTLPLPCIVEVTNLQNGRSIRVRVNDRGPFVGDRLIDLSKGAAEQLGFDRHGTTRVRVRFITMAQPLTASGLMMASNAAAPPPRRPTYAPPPAYAPVQPRDDGDMEAAPPAVTTPVDYRPEPAPYGAVRQPFAANGGSDLDAGPPEQAPPPISAPITASVLPPPGAAVRPAAYAPVSPTRPASSGAGYSVQAGAFATRSGADRAAARLATAGSAQIVPLERNGATLYRVVVGSFSDATAANETRARVMAMGFADARVVGSL